jgi:hypothetical protein
MATVHDVQRFADAHRDRLTAGPQYDRALWELVADAAHFARLGEADSADAYLGMAIVHAETGRAVVAYGWDNYKARARQWLHETATPDPQGGVGA